MLFRSRHSRFIAAWWGLNEVPCAKVKKWAPLPVVNTHLSSLAPLCCFPAWCQALLHACVCLWAYCILREEPTHLSSRSCCARPDFHLKLRAHTPQTEVNVARFKEYLFKMTAIAMLVIAEVEWLGQSSGIRLIPNGSHLQCCIQWLFMSFIKRLHPVVDVVKWNFRFFFKLNSVERSWNTYYLLQIARFGERISVQPDWQDKSTLVLGLFVRYSSACPAC